MASEVPSWGPTTAKDIEKSEDHDVVVFCGTCFLQRAFVAVLAPVDGDAGNGGLSGMRGIDDDERKHGEGKEEEGQFW